jgi:hypothetical protein
VEEPGFMLSMIMIIGLRWHERRIEKQNKQIEN